ncbi:TIGR02391 family protein [Enterococcus raffinosus]|uniref:TIGR02391 family protein n=1 Tax=Enterococcus raffinosus TaxID=71452 RepID=UPI003DA2F0E4
MSKPIDNVIVEHVSRILAEELTGSKIDTMFELLKLQNFDQLERDHTTTKWRRINESVLDKCKRTNSAIPFFSVIQYVLNPPLYMDKPDEWKKILRDINSQLMFYGFEVNDSGKVIVIKVVETFNDAQKRLQSFNERLSEYDIHSEVIKYCQSELFSENYFHAILEASKGLLHRLRDLSGLNLDGSTLVNESFIVKQPVIVIKGNKIESLTEKSEYNGLKSLLNTIVYLYRNPKAHEPKLYNPSSESDAVTAFTLMSMAHSILDNCIRVR